MASVLSIPSPNPSLLSDFKHSDLTKKNKVFSEYLSNLYSSEVGQNTTTCRNSKNIPVEIGFSHNKSYSNISNEAFLNNKLNQSYHLKHHQTHLKTITKLNDEADENDLEVVKQETINQYLKDFNEFHRVQDINHRNRISMYEDINSSKNSKQAENESNSSKSKRFSLYSIKNISKLNSKKQQSSPKGTTTNSSSSSSNDINSNSSKNSKEKKNYLSLKKHKSVKRNKSVSYKPVIGSKNVPLFKKKSTLFKISNYVTSKTAYQDNDLTNEIFNLINTERLKVLDTKSKISEALKKRISGKNYNKHSKIVNYSSNLDLRSKYDKGLLTKTELKKLMKLWEGYLTKIIALRIKERLLNPNSSSDANSISDIDSIAVNYQQSEFLPVFAERTHAKTPSSSTNGSETIKANFKGKMSPFEEKINEYIQKNRQHASFATTMDNTEFSNSYIHNKTHDTIYSNYKQ
ncbi:hypothetical protein ACO0SA_001565 [Hanseniaspora valbyensis]